MGDPEQIPANSLDNRKPQGIHSTAPTWIWRRHNQAQGWMWLFRGKKRDGVGFSRCSNLNFPPGIPRDPLGMKTTGSTDFLLEIPISMELDALDPSLPSLLTQVCQGNAGNKIRFPTGSVSGVNPKFSSPSHSRHSTIPGSSNPYPSWPWTFPQMDFDSLSFWG